MSIKFPLCNCNFFALNPVLKGKRPVNKLFNDNVVPSEEAIALEKYTLSLISASRLGVLDVLFLP